MARAAAYINLDAIAKNISLIAEKTNSDLLAVVKADAYGHGLIPVAKTAKSAGAKWLGTALLEEALALRAAGIDGPIIAWLTPPGEDFVAALENQIDLSISSVETLQEILRAAKQTQIKPRIHVEIDTGMTRGGIRDNFSQIISSLVAEKSNFVFAGLWSHFARADEPNENFTKLQLEKFGEVSKLFEESGLIAQIKHISNSAASLNFKSAHKNLIRWGIGMYGLSPDVTQMGDSKKLGLIPAMQVKSKLQLVKSVAAGAQVGYGGLGKVNQETIIGVVSMGYADGIPRISSNKAGIFVDGKRAPLLGRVSMDQFVVDLGNDSVARAGEWAYLIGSEGVAGYTADAWAKACGTINYEIVTRIGARVPRVFIN